MTLNGLLASWAGIASALGNHLWQSTLFAVVAGLITLALRKNPARARYGLWLAASVKFLVPFSLLIAIGSHLWRGPARTNAGFYHAIDAVGQPFPLPLIPEASGAYPPTVLPRATPLVPILLAVWLCGFLVIIFLWCMRWRRISATVRRATPLREGLETQALFRLKPIIGIHKRIEIFLSRASREPGIFGITRPVLLWPEGLSGRLDDAHLEAILAHELLHVRRRDNLAAAIHMLVEAVFWFHPLVWWLGARLVEEREHACDEEVLEMGSERQVYAESILKICEFCVESPLACVSGVTGSDLKKRMVYIMTRSVSRKLDFGRKLLLGAAGFAAVVVPIAFGLVKPTKGQTEAQAQEPLPPVPAFESAMIRPNNGEPMAGFTIVGKPFNAIMWKGDRLMATNFTLHGLIRVAYGVQDDQILGGPDWLNTEGYDLDAKMGKSVVDEMQKRGRRYGVSGRTLLFQRLLSDRFKLSFHRETKDLPAYALVVAANGPKIQPAKPGDTYPNGVKCLGGRPCGAGELAELETNKIVGQGVPISNLVGLLSGKIGGRIIVDKTGLTGVYDFTLDALAPMRRPESEPSLLKAVPEHVEALTKVHAIETASLLQAVSEQLGLELEPQTAPVEVLVIDHAERITGDEPSQSQSSRRPSSSPVFSSPLNADQAEASSQAQDTAGSPTYKVVSIKAHTSGNDLFNVVSIKAHTSGNGLFNMMFEENGFSATNVTLSNLLRAAYGVEESRVFGAPNWCNSEKYDVDARMGAAAAKKLAGKSQDQRNAERQRMLQALLADRFKLALHRGTKQIGAYVLISATSGPNFREGKPGDTYSNGIIDNGKPLGPDTFKLGRYAGGRGELVVQGMSMAKVVRLLSENILDRSVIDNTGLTGNYDLTLQWKIGDESQGPMFKAADHQPVSGSTSQYEFSRPSFFTAIQEQLGLKLETENGPAGILVIDHAERPLEN